MSGKIRTRQFSTSDRLPLARNSLPKQRSDIATDAETDNPITSLDRPMRADILRLQSTVGNQAVQRFLSTRASSSSVQREGEDEAVAENPLSRGQAAAAISFYRTQPKRYTPQIIMLIQDAVGTTPSGTMTNDDVQAVARWQKKLNETEDPSLKVDGMAGPRTLPTVFRQGLADQGAIENYSTKAHDLLDKWDELGTAEARIKKLVELVNKELTIANVPNCEVKIDDAGGDLGQFDFATWSLDIGKKAFEKADPTPAEKADMADTIYHESRHAEQWYRMAQFQASQGKSAQQIADDMGIPKKIADKAFADPLKKGSIDALIAEGWNESVYGSQAAHRNRVLKEVDDSGAALDKAKAAVEKDPSPANKAKLVAARARRDKALKAYFDLPEENDANRIGGRVTKAYMAKEPEEEAEAL